MLNDLWITQGQNARAFNHTETGGTIEISATSVQETGTLCDPVVIAPETYYQSENREL